MESSASENSFFKSLVLDGTNYPLWKTRMRFTIKAMDERARKIILIGWTAPKLVDKDGDYIIKPETAWTTEETQLSIFNAKAINAIFSSLDMRMFGLIADYVVAKDAWNTLQEHCEGSKSVKRTKMRLINSKFENLCMSEDETIFEYDQRIREIVTETFTLGEPISNERPVNKVIRSLPERFNGKIWALEEVKDTSKMKRTELISILQVFEMNNTAQKKDKGNTIALKTSDESYKEYAQFCQNVLQSDLGEDTISLMTKNFNEYLRRMKEVKNFDQKLKAPMFSNKPLKITGSEQSPRKFTNPPKPKMMLEGKKKPVSKKLDTVQCHACQGFGHYANECANMLRKGMNTSLSDEESEKYEEQEDEESHTALSALLESKKCFQAVVSRLEVVLNKKNLEVCQLKEELRKAKATLAKFNSSTIKLDSLLMMERDGTTGLGFENNKFEVGECSKGPVFVKESSSTKISTKKATPIDPPKPKPQPTAPSMSKRKHNGSSRHMTGFKKFLTDYVEHKSGKLTYGGGSKVNIVGKGTLNVAGLPKLRNVLHVVGLTTNLISISQLCDENLHVQFDKNECKVFDSSNLCVMIDLKKKTDEDEVDDLRDNSGNSDVVQGVTTSPTTPSAKIPETKDEQLTDENIDEYSEVNETEKNIPSRIQKNYPTSQVIGDVHGDLQTREKRRWTTENWKVEYV
ncbi:uncharacterized protein [Henckelia pumila]|uniref:uncharacterized protein n=1 Tax=Henckelia pumila TaxID=405737 RepID=UPI003C6E13EB